MGEREMCGWVPVSVRACTGGSWPVFHKYAYKFAIFAVTAAAAGKTIRGEGRAVQCLRYVQHGDSSYYY